MHRRIKEPALPAGPPLDASLLGIPPELRNAIYHAVADDIDKVSIIGRRLDQSKATSRDDSWLWNAMAKHPLSQTCGQLRREFDPIHQHRAITTGVTRYRLELENFDVERISDFAGVIRFMPKVITVQLRETVDIHYRPVIRCNLTSRIFSSIRKLETSWRCLDPAFSKLRRALKIGDSHSIRSSHEVNLNFKTRSMSHAQKKLAPAQVRVAMARQELKSISNALSRGHREFEADGLSVSHLLIISNNFDEAQRDHSMPWREARDKKASEALKQRLENELKAKLREELKAELRAKIMDELKGEAEAEIENQVREGLEGQSSG